MVIEWAYTGEEMVMDATVCYICKDKRRLADIDTSVTKIGNKEDAETLKEVLIRALSVGHFEDNPCEEEASGTFGVCIISLDTQRDGHLLALCNRIESDSVIICRRCENLLKDFEYHERTTAKIASDIQTYLTRQTTDVVGQAWNQAAAGGSSTGGPKKLDEKQSIRAAFKVMRRSGYISSTKKKGRKRKVEQIQPTDTADTSKTEESEVDQDLDVDVHELKEEEIDDDLTSVAASRVSKRIQRRREDGLVIRWGDSGYGDESIVKKEEEAEEDLESFHTDLMRPDIQPRKKRGRKSNKLKFSKPVESTPVALISSDNVTNIKFQCPFCQRYYVPSTSKVHNCTSYKNQLRCDMCNIFFTSNIRLEKHLEVIHLQHKQLHCSIGSCKFRCISETALTLHKHLHFLSERNSDGSDAVTITDDVTDVESGTNPEGMGAGQVMVMDDDQGVVTSPDMADQVSFLLDEKSFLDEGRPINIQTDGKDTNSRKQENVPRAIKTSPEKILSVPNIRLNNSECPFCSQDLDGPRSMIIHMRDVHKMVVKEKHKNTNVITIKDEGKETAVKKNFNLALQRQPKKENQATTK